MLQFIGLSQFITRMPSSLILYDDPTTGLDPIIASTVDGEIVKLRDLEQVTRIV